MEWEDNFDIMDFETLWLRLLIRILKKSRTPKLHFDNLTANAFVLANIIVIWRFNMHYAYVCKIIEVDRKDSEATRLNSINSVNENP